MPLFLCYSNSNNRRYTMIKKIKNIYNTWISKKEAKIPKYLSGKNKLK